MFRYCATGSDSTTPNSLLRSVAVPLRFLSPPVLPPESFSCASAHSAWPCRSHCSSAASWSRLSWAKGAAPHHAVSRTIRMRYTADSPGGLFSTAVWFLCGSECTLCPWAANRPRSWTRATSWNYCAPSRASSWHRMTFSASAQNWAFALPWRPDLRPLVGSTLRRNRCWKTLMAVGVPARGVVGAAAAASAVDAASAAVAAAAARTAPAARVTAPAATTHRQTTHSPRTARCRCHRSLSLVTCPVSSFRPRLCSWRTALGPTGSCLPVPRSVTGSPSPWVARRSPSLSRSAGVPWPSSYPAFAMLGCSSCPCTVETPWQPNTFSRWPLSRNPLCIRLVCVDNPSGTVLCCDTMRRLDDDWAMPRAAFYWYRS